MARKLKDVEALPEGEAQGLLGAPAEDESEPEPVTKESKEAA